MIRRQRRLRVHSQNSPSHIFDFILAYFISFFDKIEAVNAAVNLNDKPRLNDCKIYDVATNRMLAAHRISPAAQLPKRVPGDFFRRVGVFAKSPCESDGLRLRFCHTANIALD